jgi:FAD/FMN-containing dehydrogenase
VVLRTSRANRYLSFNSETGVLKAECGITLADILRDFVPRGWFLPTTPGTKFVTLGGAIANDVHGKNHHVAGTFGANIVEFELLRSNGQRLLCSPTSNSDLFAATIGGLGLTGLVTWAAIRMRRVSGPYIDQETVKYKNLDDFFLLSQEAEGRLEHTVSWVDCTASGHGLGKGLFMGGNNSGQACEHFAEKNPICTIPVDFPNFTLNSLSVKAFNTLYYGKQFKRKSLSTVHYESFFYPLDVVHGWNKIYGPAGFYQWQCVVPYEGTRSPISDILKHIAASGNASFLAVLKTFGSKQSPGMLSFPQKGVTLALDFRNRGSKTLDLFTRLDEIVNTNGGRIYPAKDARMTGHTFAQSFPRWQEFSKHIDPAFSSSFWRRLNLTQGVVR